MGASLPKPPPRPWGLPVSPHPQSPDPPLTGSPRPPWPGVFAGKKGFGVGGFVFLFSPPLPEVFQPLFEAVQSCLGPVRGGVRRLLRADWPHASGGGDDLIPQQREIMLKNQLCNWWGGGCSPLFPPFLFYPRGDGIFPFPLWKKKFLGSSGSRR